MTKIETAFLLAAGYGLRMRPLTDKIPKTLLNLGGRTLLDRALDRLLAAGVSAVVINAHWRAERLRAHLVARTGGPRTELRLEDQLLDTGGAVQAALLEGRIGVEDAPFFVVNGDCVWLDGPVATLKRLADALTPGLDGIMLVHRTFQIQGETGFGDFFLNSWGVPRRRREREVAPYLYAGITLARPRLFHGLPAASFSMNEVWDRAIEAGKLGAVVHDGLWFHLTRPEDLREAEHALAAQLTGSTT